jgi:Class II flagellar assembly regulator
MRVDPRLSSATLSPAAAPRAAAGARFAVGQGGTLRSTTAAGATVPLGSLGALLAVQGEDPSERRRRSLRRGHDLLEGLDRLKASLLAGRIDRADLTVLAAQVAGSREATGDPQLDDLLGHIELRVQVELAKLGRRDG